MIIRSIALIMLLMVAGLLAVPASSDAASVPFQAMASDTNASDDLEGATPADRSPMQDLNPAESSWQVWLGPILIGVFALALAFLIRRFSMGGRNGSRGGGER